jgi:hypothetical protein
MIKSTSEHEGVPFMLRHLGQIIVPSAICALHREQVIAVSLVESCILYTQMTEGCKDERTEVGAFVLPSCYPFVIYFAE